MVEFTYNNFKNVSMGYPLFELNYGYHPHVSFKNKYNIRSKSSSTKKLAVELQKLMNVCCQNILHAQNLLKWAYDKKVKPRSYLLGEIIWFNSKYIKKKRNQKLKAKFFGRFQVLHLVWK